MDIYRHTKGSRRVKQTDHLDSSTAIDTYSYIDGLDRIIQTRTEAESASEYVVVDRAYDEQGNLEKESLPYFDNGTSRSSITTDADLLITRTWDPLGRVKTVAVTEGTRTHSYDQWTETINDRAGNDKELTDGAFGNLAEVKEHNGGSIYTTTYEYDARDNLVTLTDALSNDRDFAYDGLGRLTNSEDLHASADSSFGSTTLTYDDSGNITSRRDAKNQLVNFTYDDINRVLTEDYMGAGGTEITYGYDDCGNGIGRLCGATTTDVISTFGYDALGNTGSEGKQFVGSSTVHTTTYECDRVGNKTKVTYPDGAEVAYNFNGAGLLESVDHTAVGTTTAATVISDLDYAPTGQVTSRVYGNGTESTYTYDADELYRLRDVETTAVLSVSTTSTSTGIVNTHAVELDGVDQWLSHDDDTVFDITGDLTIETWVKFDSVPSVSARLVAKFANAASGRSYMLWWYNSGGGRLYVTLYDGSSETQVYEDWAPSTDIWYHVAVTYDASAGEVKFYVDGTQLGSTHTGAISSLQNTSTSFTLGRDMISLNYALDGLLDDTRLWSTVRSGTEIADNRLVELSGSESGLNGYWQLDDDATDETSNGVDLTEQNTPTYSTSTPFDGNASTTAYATTTSAVQKVTYAYDAEGNITKIVNTADTGTGKSLDLEYDDLYRLIGATTTVASSSSYSRNYVYDALGNIVNKPDQGAYAYAGTGYANPHAVTSIGGTTLTYDDNGNMTNDGARSNTWNYRDRVTQTGGNSTSTYAYDHENIRAKKTTDGVEQFYVNELYNLEGSTKTAHILDLDGNLVATVEDGDTNILHSDHLGGMNVVTNPAGVVIEVADYYPFGERRIDTGSFDEQRTFTGHEFDEESDLTFAKQRYYDQDIGRFMSVDPVVALIGRTSELEEKTGRTTREYLADPQIHNSYSYARNNPLGMVDPEGELAMIPIILAAYSAAQAAIDLYEFKLTHFDYPDQFSGTERLSDKIDLGFDIGLGALGRVTADPVKQVALEVLPTALDVMDMFFGETVYDIESETRSVVIDQAGEIIENTSANVGQKNTDKVEGNES